jgi:hypothetical protein
MEKLKLGKETIATLDSQEATRIMGGEAAGATGGSVNTKFTKLAGCCTSETQACSKGCGIVDGTPLYY